MRASLINRIWTWLGLLTLLASGSSFLRARGFKIDLGLTGLSRVSSQDIVIVGFVVIGILILILHWLLRICANASKGRRPEERLPLAFASPDQIDLDSDGGKIFVWFFFWIFAILPILFLALLMLQLAIGTITYADDGRVYVVGIRQFWSMESFSLADWFGDKLRFEGGPSYFAFLTPYGYFSLLIWCVVSAFRLRKCYRPS